MNERKKIVLTLDDDVYERIQSRAKRMGISMASFCIYQVTSNISQLELAEKVATSAIVEQAENLKLLKK